jgi:Malic enzyme
LQVVINGAGAAAIATAKMFVYIGVPKKNIVMCDSKGVIGKKKNVEKLNKYKAEFATEREISTLQEAVNGADVFVGLSKGDVLTAQMLKSMNVNPIVFALANPTPEISYELVKETRDDVIFGTGRSDYPNQINNVLGFPYIFRGALDVRAKKINDEMKYAAVVAIANLAREKVPEEVLKAYNLNNLEFGKNYILPKPMDFRLMSEVSAAVAKAAVESGVARFNVDGTKVSTLKTEEEKNIMWSEYKKALELRLHALKGICYRCKNGGCV